VASMSSPTIGCNPLLASQEAPPVSRNAQSCDRLRQTVTGDFGSAGKRLGTGSAHMAVAFRLGVYLRMLESAPPEARAERIKPDLALAHLPDPEHVGHRPSPQRSIEQGGFFGTLRTVTATGVAVSRAEAE